MLRGKYLILLALLSIAQHSVAGTLSIRSAIGVHSNSTEIQEVKICGETTCYNYTLEVENSNSFDYAKNPLGLIMLEYLSNKGIYIGIMHISSIPTRDKNYGFNMMYIGRSFDWKL